VWLTFVTSSLMDYRDFSGYMAFTRVVRRDGSAFLHEGCNDEVFVFVLYPSIVIYESFRHECRTPSRAIFTLSKHDC
jgi:hypothetical protein